MMLAEPLLTTDQGLLLFIGIFIGLMMGMVLTFIITRRMFKDK